MRIRLAYCALLVLCAAQVSGRERITFGIDSLQDWAYPRGLVQVNEDGVEVRRFGKRFNAVSDIEAYRSSVIGTHGTAPVRVGSGQATMGRSRDGELDTWWSPAAADPLNQWWIELDLGRVVVADKLRIIFADSADARPFSFFSVLTSPGVRILGNADNLQWTRIDQPGQLNTQRVIEFDLRTDDTGRAEGENLSGASTHEWGLVRFIRFEAEAKVEGAAIGEIEVDGIGFNLGTRITTESRVEDGLEVWGGSVRSSDTREDEVRADGGRNGKAANPESLIGGDLAGRHWAIEAQDQPDWRASGAWWVLDMESLFRVDRILFMPIIAGTSPLHYGYDRQKVGRWGVFDFLYSDGSSDSEANPFVEGPYDYKLLTAVDNCGANAAGSCTSNAQSYYDFAFEPTPMRYLMWRRISDEQQSKAAQVWIFHAEGFPAQVRFESEDIDLDGARSIAKVEWDGDVPAGTSIEVLTQTGEGFDQVTEYTDANGRVVTKERWDVLRDRQKGPILTKEVRDASWSDWSAPHRVSGEAFRSPTPRRWIRVLVRLNSDVPELFPSLRSISFETTDPVVTAGVVGEILPREAALDSLQEFTYTLAPGAATAGDAGFDRILIKVPSAAIDATVSAVIVGNNTVQAPPAELRGDSLIVSLPLPAVRQDTVRLTFRSRVFENPTIFDAFVFNSQTPEEVQGVVPAGVISDRVFIPDITGSGTFFRNIISDRVFSPNGDDINDEFEFSFNLVKASFLPEVVIHRLDGQQVTTLVADAPLTGRARFEWTGTDEHGTLVPPGPYLLRAQVQTDSGDETIIRLVHLVY